MASLLAQSIGELEVILVDDASTDGGGEIARELAAADARVRLVALAQNAGAGVARNAALPHARGEFVAFCDADDCFAHAGSLAKLYHAAKSHGAAVCGGSMSFADPACEATARHAPELAGFFFARDGAVDYAAWQFDYGFTRFIYARELAQWARFGELRWFEDPPFLARALARAGWFYALGEAVYRADFVPKRLTLRQVLDGAAGVAENLRFARQRGFARLGDYTKARFAALVDRFSELRVGAEILREAVADEPELLALICVKKTPPQRIFSVKNFCDKKIITIFGAEFALGRGRE